MGRPAPLSLDWEATSDTLGAELNGTRLIGTAGEDAFVRVHRWKHSNAT